MVYLVSFCTSNSKIFDSSKNAIELFLKFSEAVNLYSKPPPQGHVIVEAFFEGEARPYGGESPSLWRGAAILKTETHK